jgi:Tol biopolymer transport system component
MKKYLWICLAAAMVLSCGLPARIITSATPTDQTPQSSGLIGYIGSDGNVYIVDPDGGNKKSITNDANPSPPSGETARFYQQPTWSPDGQYIAFLGFHSSTEGAGDGSLYTAAADGSELVEAFTSKEFLPFYLYWTPDSRSVSFLSNGASDTELVLHLAAAAGGESHILGRGQPFYWAWSPLSDELVIHTGGDSASNPQAKLAYLPPVEEGKETSIDLSPASFQAPDWSVDGVHIVVAAVNDDGKNVLELAGRGGSKPVVLVEFQGSVAFSFSPDGHSLAYSVPVQSEEDSSGLLHELFVLDPNIPEKSNSLLRDLVVGYFWAPDSQHIAYFAPFVATPGSSKESALMPVEVQMGLFVVDVQSKKAQRVAAFSPTHDFLQILPFYDQYQRSVTIWSPDSRQLVYSAVGADETSGIYVVQSEGESLPKRIADGEIAFWSWK